MAAVDLVYRCGCPNIEPARANITAAFEALGLKPGWLEWDADDAATPTDLRGYGSPTVLVDGRDVQPDARMAHHAMACRVYPNGDGFAGAPDATLIAHALARSATASFGASSKPSATSRWRQVALFGPAVGVAAVPVGLCPVCFAAYVGAFGALGLGFLLDTRVLAPVTVLALLLALIALGWRTPARRGYRPLLLGTAGAIGIAVGQLVLAKPLLVWAGVAALLSAAVWSAWPTAIAHRCAACPADHPDPAPER